MDSFAAVSSRFPAKQNRRPVLVFVEPRPQVSLALCDRGMPPARLAVPFTGDATGPCGVHSAVLPNYITCLFRGASSVAAYGHSYIFDLIKKHWSYPSVPGRSVALPLWAKQPHTHCRRRRARSREPLGEYDDRETVLDNLWTWDLQIFDIECSRARGSRWPRLFYITWVSCSFSERFFMPLMKRLIVFVTEEGGWHTPVTRGRSIRVSPNDV